MPTGHPSARAALAWLTDPVTCVALLLLVLNDHLLKASFGTWWTGKLSDVAWLVVAPPLVAVLLAGASRLVAVAPVDARTCTRASLAVVGTAFVVVKATAVGATAASAVLTALAGPSTVLADPTDLLTLPALALAGYAARTTSTDVRHGQRRDLRWVLVLPVAVLATTATSSSPPEEAHHVAVVDGAVVVGDPWGGTWYTSDDGARWSGVDVFSDEDDELDDRFEERDTTLTVACAPSPSDQCFRARAEGVGVDRSDDGGRTWRQDWAIPDELLPELAARYEPPTGSLWTRGVAVLPTPDGFRVVAANGGDGLAVRDEHGTWTRIGFTYKADGPPVVPLPGEPTTFRHPMPVEVMLVVPAAAITLMLSVRRRQPRGTRSRRQWGWLTFATAVVLSAVGLFANDATRAVAGQSFQDVFLVGDMPVTGLFLGLFVVSSALLVVAAVLLRGGPAAGMVAATGVGVALVVGLVSPTTLAAVTAVALIGAGSVATARLATAPRD